MYFYADKYAGVFTPVLSYTRYNLKRGFYKKTGMYKIVLILGWFTVLSVGRLQTQGKDDVCQNSSSYLTEVRQTVEDKKSPWFRLMKGRSP